MSDTAVAEPGFASASSRSARPARRRQAAPVRSLSAILLKLGSLVFTLASIAALVVGWRMRDEHLISPDDGLGYWLGVVGGVAMLLLLVYPLRKRAAWTRFFGSVTLWFRIHMMLGVIGPVLVLYHASFGFGSINANVAMITMLLVAGSGLIGRYLYAGVHRSSDNRAAAVKSFIDAYAATSAVNGASPEISSHLLDQMRQFSDTALPGISPSASLPLFKLFGFRIQARRFEHQTIKSTRRLISSTAKAGGWPRRVRKAELRLADKTVKGFSTRLRSAAAAATFVRLFALWHVLHLPLFFLLVVAAALHVIAVHIY